MRKEDFYEALGEIDEAAVAGAAAPPNSKRRVKTVIIAAAAAACIVIGAGVFLARPGVVISDPDTSEAASAAESPAATDNGAADSITDSVEVIQIATDRAYYCYTLEELLEYSDAVIVGEIISEPEAVSDSDLSRSLVRVRVERVLEGSVPSEEITLLRSYQYYNSSTIVSSGELSPDTVGERWIMFLVYNEEKDRYGITSDGMGRYPLPENLDKPDGFGYKNGLLESGRFSYPVCEQVYERYGLE